MPIDLSRSLAWKQARALMLPASGPRSGLMPSASESARFPDDFAHPASYNQSQASESWQAALAARREQWLSEVGWPHPRF